MFNARTNQGRLRSIGIFFANCTFVTSRTLVASRTLAIGRTLAISRTLAGCAFVGCTLLSAFALADTPVVATNATAAPSTVPRALNDAPAASAQQRALNEQVQDIKKQALELNRDLFNLEEELLFPANTQVAVFVSMDVGEFFQLDAVQIKLDDKVVANYLYTERQVDALHRGGVQRLYVGNVKGGKHEIVAVLTGRGPHDRDYRRGATFTFEKADQAKYVELKIVDSLANYQPEFQLKEWQ
jgi:hypothetical protein